MLFLRLIKMIIAPLVFATLVGGIAHMGSSSKLGRHLCENHGLVHQRLLCFAAARPRDGQSAAARRQFPGTLPDKAQSTGLPVSAFSSRNS